MQINEYNQILVVFLLSILSINVCEGQANDLKVNNDTNSHQNMKNNATNITENSTSNMTTESIEKYDILELVKEEIILKPENTNAINDPPSPFELRILSPQSGLTTLLRQQIDSKSDIQTLLERSKGRRFTSRNNNRDLQNVTGQNSDYLVPVLEKLKLILKKLNSTVSASEIFKNDSLLLGISDKVSAVQTSIDDCKEDYQHRMNLVLENFSTLKLLLSSHEGRIQENSQQISTTKNQITDIVIQKYSHIEFVTKNSTENKDHKFENITPVVPENNFISENITKKLTELTRVVEANQVKYSELNETVLHLSNENKTCNCIENKNNINVISKSDEANLTEGDAFLNVLLKSSIESLKKDIENLKLKTNVLTSHLEKEKNSSTSGTSENDVVSTKLVPEVMTSSDVEAKLLNLEDELVAVRDLRDEVAELRRMVERKDRNESRALCVWPYKPSNDGCYHVNTEERLSWIAARGRCQELQGDLASPRNFESFRQFLISQRLSRSYSFWVSGTDQEREGQWYWVDGRPVAKVVWASGQPNQLRSANCLEIKPGFKFVGADEDCRQQKYFICQQRGS